MRRSAPATLAFGGLLLGLASAAHACGYGGPPDSISTLPGMGFYRPDLLFLFPILSGTLERPFYTLAGHRTSTLAYSIQANFIASILIGVAGFFGYAIFSELGVLLLLLAAPVAGMGIKLWWFGRVPRETAGRQPVGLFLLATVFSSLTIALIPVAMAVFGTNTYAYAEKTQAVRLVAICVTLLAAIGVHCALFSNYKREEATDRRRGFDVLPADRGEGIPVAVPAAAD